MSPPPRASHRCFYFCGQSSESGSVSASPGAAIVGWRGFLQLFPAAGPFLHLFQNPSSPSVFPASPCTKRPLLTFYRVQRIAHRCLLPRPGKRQNLSLLEHKGLAEEFFKGPKASR